jgi:hypothetical protein
MVLRLTSSNSNSVMSALRVLSKSLFGAAIVATSHPPAKGMADTPQMDFCTGHWTFRASGLLSHHPVGRLSAWLAGLKSKDVQVVRALQGVKDLSGSGLTPLVLARRMRYDPPRNLTGWVLRDLGMSLGFEGLLAANINLDLLGLGFGPFGELNLQHAFLVVGVHLSRCGISIAITSGRARAACE